MNVINVYDLKDYAMINDSCSSIRGYVVMTDEHGKTLFAKNNMIVKTGRKYIKQALFNSCFSSGTYTIPEFKTIKFGNNNSVTKPEDTTLKGMIDENKLNITTTVIKADEGDILADGSIKIIIKSDISLNNSEDIIISEAGLFFYDDSDEDTADNMFSRVAFAPVTIRPKTTYILNYYIYF